MNNQNKHQSQTEQRTAQPHSHESRVEAGKKAAETRGHESLSQAEKKGSQAGGGSRNNQQNDE